MNPRCVVHSSDVDSQVLRELISRSLPDGTFEQIFIKPNWVKHEEDPRFPISALVTARDIIDSAVQMCLDKYTSVGKITVGDVPLQTCDWDLLAHQAGIDVLAEKFGRYKNPLIRFLDLRKEKYDARKGYLLQSRRGEFGDPLGYREVMLDQSSFLEPISPETHRFRVSDYSPEDMTVSHRPGYHRYLICGSVLESDLFINLPKMKTHQKTGITGALKNLVGINGQKSFLVHFRQGRPSTGGDEFPESISSLIVLQTRVRDLLQKRSSVAFGALRQIWRVIKSVAGIQTVGTRENLNRKFYISAGSWYGNQTIWRMVYDLNKIILFAAREGGPLTKGQQRAYTAILDGLTAGEGNGPLQPLRFDAGVIAASEDPFLLDMSMAHMMGFDYTKIPLLSNYRAFPNSTDEELNPEMVSISLDDKEVTGISSLPIVHRFAPPPGWRGHIEMEGV
jgi:hypothetical protein